MSNQFTRYDSYKDSGVEWLGQIPKHWEVNRLGSKFLERKAKVSDKEYPALSVTKNGIVPQLENAAKTNDGDNRKLVKAGDFVINSRSDRKGSSGISIYNGSVSLINIVLKPISIKSKFCHYLLKSYSFIEEFYRNGHGIVADLWTTRFEEMRAILLALPTEDEQQRIADFLDKKTAQIDEAIAKKEKMIELLKEYRQVVINNAVTKGLDPNVPMKDSGVGWLGQIPAHWNISKLKFVTRQIVDGTHFTPTYRDSGVPFLRVTDLHHQTLELNDVKFISHKEHNDLIKRCNPTKGDLLLSKNGTIGLTKVVDWDFEFSIFVSLCLIKINYSLLNAHLLSYQINSNIFIQQLIESGKTTSVTNLHLDMIKDLIVVLPSIIEQQEIADFLDKKNEQIDEAISLKQSEIEKLKEYKATLIDSAVTGKIKV